MRLFTISALVITFLFIGCGSSENSDSENDNNQDGNNNAPISSNITTSSDLTSPYMQVSLIATDEDGDTLSYYLQNPYEGSSGSGYEYAFIEPNTNQLYVILRSDYTNDNVVLNYQASDSIEFSNSASVTITITSSEDHGLGYESEDTTTYAQTPTHYFDDSILGAYNNELPSSVDLSNNMPTPGNQGNQNSCVGWAVGYAIKSYHEKLEMGWELNSPNTVFSPSYIYNQINNAEDLGSKPSDAFNLLVNSGAATWATMPYNVNDYLTQPTSLINESANNFKAKEYKRLTDKDQMKAALANKHPIMIAIRINNTFSPLHGSDSVYSSAGNYNPGGHAVTITGYDDSKYGGAFKIINSYGIDWGDNGYFWLPYDRVSDHIMVAYILVDKENGTAVDTIEDIPEPIRDNLPNLEVQTWNASFNQIPGGSGTLTYTINNSGTGTASAYFDVNLMLSTDQTFTTSDIYVAYEEVPFDLLPGHTASREVGNERNFNFPQTLQAGTYYMALWVDDVGEVAESNEGDNISVGGNTVQIQSASLPDITIDSWSAQWDNNYNGTLSYRVCNTGGTSTTKTNWDLNLVLSTTPNPEDDPNLYFIFYEDVGYILDPIECIYRDEYNLASFSLLEDQYTGGSVALGTYYMSFWVDDQNFEEESNEYNNYSTGNNRVTLSSINRSVTKEKSAFNAKNFSNISDIKKVIVSVDSDGKRSFKILNNDNSNNIQEDTNVYYQKTVSSKSETVFPTVEKHSMPSKN